MCVTVCENVCADDPHSALDAAVHGAEVQGDGVSLDEAIKVVEEDIKNSRSGGKGTVTLWMKTQAKSRANT
jgi:hypothetical protein